MRNKIKSLVKKPLLIVGVVIFATIAVYLYSSRDTGPIYETITATLGNVMEEVSVTGRVKPAEEISLAFERAGRISGVNVSVGDKVSAGQIMASLDSSESQTQLTQAEADLKVQEIKIVNAEIALEEAKKGLVDKVQDAYTKADDALRTKADQIFFEPGFNPKLRFTLDDTTFKAKVEADRLSAEGTMNNWQGFLAGLSTSSDLTSQIIQAKGGLNTIKILLDEVAVALNNYTLTTYPTQATINAWRSDISSGRSSISTATSSLLTADEKWKTSDSALVLERARINSNKASVENYKAQLAKSVVYSPISGLITRVDAKPGETVSLNSAVITLISQNDFEVETNIPEVDISKVKLGNEVEITLDAYGNDITFGAEVISIDPAETVIEGVTTYKVKIAFNEKDERIKPGMTANISIFGKKSEDIIAVPQRAVVTRDNGKFVRILDGKEIREVEVVLGIRGSSGSIEIVSGINEGDKVVISISE
jgi:HlyD family secretion protein